MPPIKEYKFESMITDNVFTIYAYTFEQAYELLVKEVRHPADFKCITP